MPITKPCICQHLKSLHHLTNGETVGACSVASCRCTGYVPKESARKEANSVILTGREAELHRRFMKMRRAYLAMEQLMRDEYGMELNGE